MTSAHTQSQGDAHRPRHTVEVPADVIELAHHHIDPFPVEVVRGPQGSFGPEVEPPADATDSERFLAWTGRDPRVARPG